MSQTSSNIIPVNSPEKEVTMEHSVLMEFDLPTSQAIPLHNVELSLTSNTTLRPSLKTCKPTESESPKLNPKDLTARLEDIKVEIDTLHANREGKEVLILELQVVALKNEIAILQLRVDDAEARQAEDHAQIQSILARLARAEGNAIGNNAKIQLQAKEFDLMAVVVDLDEIKEVNANIILMVNLQQASTSDTQTDKARVYDSDGSAEVSEQEDTTKGMSTNTKFANQSTKRKPSLQPLRNNFVVRQPNAFQSEHTKFSKTRVPQKVDETNDLSNPVSSN
nr:hypothetical protein [Tanacetum cinerariifolium]